MHLDIYYKLINDTNKGHYYIVFLVNFYVTKLKWFFL